MINLTAVGLRSGNESGTLLNVHPAFDDLDLQTRIRAEQAITKSLLQLDPDTATDATLDLRTRWTRLRLIRNALNISGLALTVAATLHRPAKEARRP